MCSSGRFVQREYQLQREVVITVANNQNLRTRRQDLGTADSNGIVTFTSWTHPPDLDPDFSPGGFWHSHTIPEAERTRALATIQQWAAAKSTSAAAETTSAAAETTSAAAETTSAAAETTSAAAETTSAAAETTSAAVETTSAAAETTTAAVATSTPIAGPSTPSVFIDDPPPTLAQQLTPTQREVHRGPNFTAGFYSNSDIAGVLDKDSLLLIDGRELQRVRGTCFTCPEADLSHQPFVSHHNPRAPAYTPLEKVYSDILYNREPGQNAYNYTITFINAATRYVLHLNLPSRNMAFEAFVAWLPVAERESGVKLKSFQSDGGGEYASQRFKQYLAERGIKRLISLPYAHQQQGVAERMNRTLQATMRKLLRKVAARDVIFYENLTLRAHLAYVEENRPDLSGGFLGTRAFASAEDEADWDEQNVEGASEEAGTLPYCSADVPMDDEENPRDSINAEAYYHFVDNGYVTPAQVNTDEAERIGPNFNPTPEAGDEAVYPKDTTLPRYT
ncbi:unnamed protein product [Closterium sp. Yama58-4]|nr:unnamed protein product [Closterium sp. Yama58-4]